MSNEAMAAQKPRATIASIAAEIGVSVPTVSKVLNGRPDVASQTRAKVEEALERHQYRRRRSGHRTSSALLDLVFHELDSAWSVEIIRGVEAVAAARQIGVVLSELGGEHRPKQEWLDAVLARRPAGVLFVLSGVEAAQRYQLESRSIPFLVLDTDGEPPVGIPTVGSNNWSGGLSASRHLLGLGHRSLAVISGPKDVLCSRARVDGFRSAHDEVGVSVNPEFIRHGLFHVSTGYQHGRDLLDRPDRPTAIFAGSDMQALGVLRAAHELGLRVPEDLSIVGYDDVAVSQWIEPALTTVHQPLREMAATATRMLLQLADGQTLAHQRIELATELVVRRSTAPPPS
ncbi:LacI family DNA-binding transcriptional regulator [Pseudactinotalea sp. Z1739]|uniref:LacI family DNA-binding transcriptional regulator n=1 Tax=Pseudactinotalea sp. Z1739 TaxID=3413028 RepID=UPI003C7C6528